LLNDASSVPQLSISPVLSKKLIIAPPCPPKATIPSQSMKVHIQCWTILLQIVSPFYPSLIPP
jgi:hypothetical protein